MKNYEFQKSQSFKYLGITTAGNIIYWSAEVASRLFKAEWAFLH